MPASWGRSSTGESHESLREPSQADVAIRLAYVHNLGDTLLSLAPVAAGILVLVSGHSFFDPAIALGIAVIIVATTVRSIAPAHQELLWPPAVVCGHADDGKLTKPREVL